MKWPWERGRGMGEWKGEKGNIVVGKEIPFRKQPYPGN